MLVYDLEDIEADELLYSYQVEGRADDVGGVSIDVTGATSIRSLAPGNRQRRYAMHLAFRLKEISQENDFKDRGLAMRC